MDLIKTWDILSFLQGGIMVMGGLVGTPAQVLFE
jgi:hypothetical protein